MKISIVTPAYKCAGCIEEMYKRLVLTMEKITADFEIIFVNDASPQNDWEIISKLAILDNRVKGINFSRNYGQHYAITAGLDNAFGEWVVVMDCDLQDQPEEIIKLYNKAQEGYDTVFERRHERKDSFFKTIPSLMFNKVFSYLSGIKLDPTTANFSISKQVVIQNFRLFREHNRSFPQFINLVGFKKGLVDIDHATRHEGKSSYNFKRLLNFAIDNIVAYSNKPLKISIKLGFLISTIAAVLAIYLLYRHFILKIHVDGWTSIMLSVWFIGGLLFANMGLLGVYVGKIFDETKNRPLYIIKDLINFERKL